MPNEFRSIEDVRRKFAADWAGDFQPKISDYLDLVVETELETLISVLVPIDIENRLAKGLSPHSDDYSSLGMNGEKIAEAYLEQSQLLEQSMGGTALHDSLEPSMTSPQHDQYIGRYKLLEPIGEGGMGMVWLAEQEEPVRRRVALKVIRSELGTKPAIARFEAERQAIALMDHQNIATILDAGTTDAGSPYFVMELVTGVPLNRYCDKNRLTVRERLELMIPVCLAVQHAHQKGIIHRDLKHSNVIVAEYDGKPVPKVIDFGLAKALGTTLTDKTVFTEAGKVLGTLHYMSPEQAEGNNLDIDTRSDIYSLGVMLYKMLTGLTPLKLEQTDDMSYLSALRAVREKDPVRPSLSVNSRIASLQEICERRQTDPIKLSTTLAGELDCIVMKTLEKDRRDRYETANALAMEIRRFLNDEPVLARPHSAIYSLKKFMRRNRKLVAALSTIAFLLIAGIVATTSATFWALSETKRANREAKIAKAETANAKIATAAARESEKRRSKLQAKAEVQLRAMQIKSAWSDWQLGNSESALQMMNQLPVEDPLWQTRYLRTEFDSSESIFYGHSRNVMTVAAAKDGKLIASGGMDSSLKVWDTQKNELVFNHKLTETLTGISFSSNGLIACADRANYITVFNAASGKLEKQFGPFPSDITCITFSPDNQFLIAGANHEDTFQFRNYRDRTKGFTPSIRIISWDDGQVIQELSEHELVVTGIACSRDGKTMVSSSEDRTLRIWKRESEQYQLHSTIDKNNFEVNDVTISNSGDMAASCDGKTIRLWDLSKGELVRTFTGHTERVDSVQFSPDDSRLVSGSADGSAIIWSLEGRRILDCRGHFGPLNAVCFGADGKTILTGSDDKTVRVWNANHRKSTLEVNQHSDVVWAADFSPKGKWVVSVSEDGTVAIIDTETGELYGKKFAHVPGTPTDKANKSVAVEINPEVGDPAVVCVAVTQDGKWIVTGGADGLLRIWDFHTQQLSRTIQAHDDVIWNLDISPDGKRLATASADRYSKIWNIDDWSLQHTFPKNEDQLASVEFSPDGALLATAGDEGIIQIWNATTLELETEFSGPQNTIWRAVFSPDSQLIASSSYAGEIFLWDIAKEERLLAFEGHSAQVAGLSFTPDGRQLVSASDDGTIKFWDIESGIELFVLRDVSESYAVHVSFSNDGTKMVVGGKDWVTIRSAAHTGLASPTFLPQDAHRLAVSGLLVVVNPEATTESLKKEFEIATRCCKYFPSFRTYTNLGIAGYRLGNYSKAIEALEEARRVEPFEYGQPDLRPDIEGYLALALFKQGHEKRAKELREVFETKFLENWTEDELSIYLRGQIGKEFKNE